MSPRTAIVRILAALHAWLGRKLARNEQPTVKGKRTRHRKREVRYTADSARPPERKGVSWFDLPPDTLELPRSAEEQEADDWYRAHFRVNGQPWNPRR